jgi:hypothetical protein
VADKSVELVRRGVLGEVMEVEGGRRLDFFELSSESVRESSLNDFTVQAYALSLDLSSLQDVF